MRTPHLWQLSYRAPRMKHLTSSCSKHGHLASLSVHKQLGAIRTGEYTSLCRSSLSQFVCSVRCFSSEVAHISSIEKRSGRHGEDGASYRSRNFADEIRRGATANAHNIQLLVAVKPGAAADAAESELAVIRALLSEKTQSLRPLLFSGVLVRKEKFEEELDQYVEAAVVRREQQEQIDDLKDRNQAWEKAFNELEKENQKYKDRHHSTRSELNRLLSQRGQEGKDLLTAKQRIEELEREKNQQEKLAIAAEEGRSSAVQKMNDAETKAAKCMAAEKQAIQAKEHAEEIILKLEKDRDEAQKERNDANSRVLTAKARQACAESQAQMSSIAEKDAIQAKESAERDRDTMQKERDDARARQLAAESEAEASKVSEKKAVEAKKSAEKDRELMQKERDDAMLHSTKAREAKKSMEKDRDSMQKERDDAKTRQAAAESEADSSRSAEREAINAKQSAEHDRDTMQKERDDAQARQLAAESEAEASKVSEKKAVEAKKSAEKDRELMQKERDDAMLQSTKAREAKESIEKERDNMQKERDDAKTRQAAAESEAEVAHAAEKEAISAMQSAEHDRDTMQKERDDAKTLQAQTAAEIMEAIQSAEKKRMNDQKESLAYLEHIQSQVTKLPTRLRNKTKLFWTKFSEQSQMPPPLMMNSADQNEVHHLVEKLKAARDATEIMNSSNAESFSNAVTKCEKAAETLHHAQQKYHDAHQHAHEQRIKAQRQKRFFFILFLSLFGLSALAFVFSLAALSWCQSCFSALPHEILIVSRKGLADIIKAASAFWLKQRISNNASEPLPSDSAASSSMRFFQIWRDALDWMKFRTVFSILKHFENLVRPSNVESGGPCLLCGRQVAQPRKPSTFLLPSQLSLARRFMHCGSHKLPDALLCSASPPCDSSVRRFIHSEDPASASPQARHGDLAPSSTRSPCNSVASSVNPASTEFLSNQIPTTVSSSDGQQPGSEAQNSTSKRTRHESSIGPSLSLYPFGMLASVVDPDELRRKLARRRQIIEASDETQVSESIPVSSPADVRCA